MLAWAGLYLSKFTRKQFWVEPGRVRVHDGLALTSRVYPWQAGADIALRSESAGQGEWWLVDLVCGKPPLHAAQGSRAPPGNAPPGQHSGQGHGGRLVENNELVIPSEGA